ncbi:MAG: hypothetical protein EHM42_07820 [Planctomycetaceae bacterium]|nr:MAG: hypothetical protein EHM42_07820 [Planctomycetaceae bacterium]
MCRFVQQLAAAIFIVALCLGCESQSSRKTVPLQPVSARERALRRAYEGAPPVIPHPPLSGKCATCHTATGSEVPGLGIAPANPHAQTPGMSADARCRQCHVFAQTTDLFQPNAFVGASVTNLHGDRAQPQGPPRIPHDIFMRERCAACHSGPAARPELVCGHTERTNCRQCHLRQSAIRSASMSTAEGDE